jgi:signal transduction histidine kinase
MIRLKVNLALTMVLDVLLLALALFNLPFVHQRAKAPFLVDKIDGHLTVVRISQADACPSLQEGDRLLEWNTHKVATADGVEFLGDLSAIGEKITCKYERRGEYQTGEITLIRYYESPRFAIIMTLVGVIIWWMAVFVAFNRLDGTAAYSLHWALIALSLTLLLTQGRVSAENILSIVSRLGLLISYLLMAGLFFFFTTIYPHNKFGSEKLKAFVVFSPIVLCIAATAYCFFGVLHSSIAVESYIRSYDIYHSMVIFFGVGSIISVLDSYSRAQSAEDRSRLQWILWGMVVGQVPDVLFIVMPQLLLAKDLIPEEYAIAFVLATPFSFAVSFVKYRLFDVEVMINRSIVYSLLTLFIGLMYVLLVLVGTSLIGGEIAFTKYLIVSLVTFVLAWILNPFRLRLQRIVDEALFPARVHYNQTVAHVTDEMRKIISIPGLAQYIVQSSLETIPLGGIAFYLVEDGTLSCQYAQGNVTTTVQAAIPVSLRERLISGYPIALPSTAKSSREEVDVSQTEWLQNIGFSLCIPLVSESRSLFGMIAVSPRSGNEKFTLEEIELLKAIGTQASEALDRLVLQKKVILEHAERQKVEELSRLKSYFVSSVSHELRTPLTSIRMFAETLRHGKIQNKKKQNEYLDIIDQEAMRLSRLIDNVLDFSRIERGVKEYHFASTDICEVVTTAAKTMKNQFDERGVKFHITLSKSLPKIDADRDALEEAVINLLSNALKYSGGKNKVTLKARQTGKDIAIQVSDHGVGIAKEELNRIFDPFYRVREKQSAHIKGVGLGLSLVKHIIEAHGGSIEVQSILGKGSQFTIHLPVCGERGGREQ